MDVRDDRLLGHKTKKVLSRVGQHAPRCECACVIHGASVELRILLKQRLPLKEVVVIQPPNDDAHVGSRLVFLRREVDTRDADFVTRGERQTRNATNGRQVSCRLLDGNELVVWHRDDSGEHIGLL
jgi:hypothetical protein